MLPHGMLDSLPCCVLDLQEGHGGEDGGAGVCGGLAHGLQQSVQLSRDGHRRPLHHRDSLRYAHNALTMTNNMVQCYLVLRVRDSCADCKSL